MRPKFLKKDLLMDKEQMPRRTFSSPRYTASAANGGSLTSRSEGLLALSPKILSPKFKHLAAMLFQPDEIPALDDSSTFAVGDG